VRCSFLYASTPNAAAPICAWRMPLNRFSTSFLFLSFSRPVSDLHSHLPCSQRLIVFRISLE
jgi:hypothetical protein